MFCRNCGETLPEQATYCTRCGLSAAGQAQLAPLGKSRIAAGILGILLGGFGVHRFYLGYTGLGVLQIFVTLITCGAGALWGLIEGILILTGSFPTDANGVPLRD